MIFDISVHVADLLAKVNNGHCMEYSDT